MLAYEIEKYCKETVSKRLRQTTDSSAVSKSSAHSNIG